MSTQGTVLAVNNFTPPYAVSNYSDTQIFVPYSALNMEGKMRLKARLSIYDVGTSRHIAYSNYIVFNFNGN
jgi:hypothetical protein